MDAPAQARDIARRIGTGALVKMYDLAQAALISVENAGNIGLATAAFAARDTGGVILTEVIGVRFKRVGKVYYFNPDKLDIPAGANVIVETARGVEMGEVVLANHMVEDGAVVQPLKKVIRVATDKDLATVERHRKKEKETFATCEKGDCGARLDMKLVDVEYTFDGNKIPVLLHGRRQGRFPRTGQGPRVAVQNAHRASADRVRDEAKMQGGLGVCGKELCCTQFFGRVCARFD